MSRNKEAQILRQKGPTEYERISKNSNKKNTRHVVVRLQCTKPKVPKVTGEKGDYPKRTRAKLTLAISSIALEPRR